MQRIKKAYAENGDLKIIPETPPLDGSENWEQGRGAYYELDNDPNTGDPLALDIDREQDNYFKNVISKNIKHWQENTYPIYFDDIEYPKNAIVKYTDGNIYVSKVDNNTSIPTDSNNNWGKMPSIENLALTVDTIDDFPTSATTGDTCIVKDLDRGGIFIYDSTKVSEHNEGTNFNGWIRQYSGAVNVKWFGAIPYKVGQGIDSSMAINNAYKFAVINSIPMEILDNFYISNSLIFSLRAGVSAQYRIIANCTIFCEVGNNSAIYVGDDSSHGIYNLNIDGMMNIKSLNLLREGVGFHLQSAAYGHYNILSSGFDIGIKLEGSIFVTLDGKGGNTASNNIDVVIEPNQGVQGGVRHTNNVSKFVNMSLNSSNKVLMRSGDLNYDVGGVIQFDNILFEGNTTSDYQNEASIVCYNASETVASSLGKIKFSNCWFESWGSTKPLLNAVATDVILEYSFIANNGSESPYFYITSNSSLHFNNCTGYFGDKEPIHLVAPLTMGDTGYRGQIFLNNTQFYGHVGTFISIHDGISKAISDRIRWFRGNGISTLLRVSGASNVFPSDCINDYMQNGTINITEFLNSFIGNNWERFVLSISGSDGGAVNAVKIEGYRFPGGSQTYLQTIIRGNGLTTADNITFSFPTSLNAGWFKPEFILEASSCSGSRTLVP